MGNRVGEYAVEVEGLTKRFGSFTAVDGVSFGVRRGEIFGFLGPNGAGKTTTIHMLLGLVRPSAGSARVLGYEVTHTPDEVRQHIGYMSQRFSLYRDLTVGENLDFYGRTYGVRGAQLRARKDFVLEMAGLTGRERQLTRSLSGGWKQRLALGAAILHDPEVLFLDEPTAGVDPISRRGFWNLLYQLAEDGKTIFVTTHYMDEAEHCRTLAFISSGRLIAQGSPAEIKAGYAYGAVLEVDCDRPDVALGVLRVLPGLDEVALYGSRLHVSAPDVEERREAIARCLDEAGVTVYSLALIPPSLEDVFISRVRRPGGEGEVGAN